MEPQQTSSDLTNREPSLNDRLCLNKKKRERILNGSREKQVN